MVLNHPIVEEEESMMKQVSEAKENKFGRQEIHLSE